MTGRSWDHSGRTRQQRGYGREHERIRDELLRTIILCEECRRKDPPRVTAGVIADHIIPLTKGGTGDRSNYQLLCRDCADEKDALDRGQTRKPKKAIGSDGWPA